MKITLREWVELNQRVKPIAEGLNSLERRLLQMLLDHKKDDGPVTPEQELLSKLSDRVAEAMLVLNASAYHPQSEWTGGPSEDPRNHTVREPHWINIAHTFPKEQVDEFRGPDGEIRFPQIRDGNIVPKKPEELLAAHALEIYNRWNRIRDFSYSSGQGMIGCLVDKGFIDWLDSLLHGIRKECTKSSP